MTFNYVLPNNQIKEAYEPNNTYDLGLSLSHKWFAIWYSYGIFNSRNIANFGKSKSLDIQGDVFLGNKSIITIMYQNYCGFYAQKNPSLTPSFFDTLPSVKREDLKIKNFGLQYLFVVSGDKLSFRASYSQTQVQLKSKGSFIFGAGMNYFKISADSSIVNRDFNSKDSLIKEYQYMDGYFYSPAIRAGYVLNLVFLRSISLLLSAVPGISYGYSSYLVENDKTPRARYGFNYQVQFRYGLQFNTKYIFFGLDGTTDLFSQQLQQGYLVYTPTRAELFVGFRLNAPEFLCPKCRR